jgi:hypothetical protein
MCSFVRWKYWRTITSESVYDGIFVENWHEVDKPVFPPSQIQFIYFLLFLYVSSFPCVTYLVFKIHVGANRTKLILVSRIADLEIYVTSLQYACSVTMATQLPMLKAHVLVRRAVYDFRVPKRWELKTRPWKVEVKEGRCRNNFK